VRTYRFAGTEAFAVGSPGSTSASSDRDNFGHAGLRVASMAALMRRLSVTGQEMVETGERVGNEAPTTGNKFEVGDVGWLIDSV
jgi:hypothetical protein